MPRSKAPTACSRHRTEAMFNLRMTRCQFPDGCTSKAHANTTTLAGKDEALSPLCKKHLVWYQKVGQECGLEISNIFIETNDGFVDTTSGAWIGAEAMDGGDEGEGADYDEGSNVDQEPRSDQASKQAARTVTVPVTEEDRPGRRDDVGHVNDMRHES
jgi:hypothetical protein